ncbi:uncharacterized protein DUF3883 [Mangrovibacterium marinum]|uniref:Uncharacterized protein DUF3883 n=1 Tax=Mangrovibacterium marinum TaxID=1639118 RepID=A0A2T5C3E3_9BACT|nr:DUF3883 domain-containing protein [Mangrovibacterium marinum]PTN09302.1 uncharacterized protein DUF3883 [Mangrovibacterium marinum]
MTKTIIQQPPSVQGAFEDLLNKMYISNVRNRLRQLNEPTDNDSKRWVWELIQNAKDSIVGDPTRDSVDVKIVVRDNEVKFKHNGSPFTGKALLGLLYKYSDGKTNNSESTGRFGTGFLTTHTLSKVVSIEGDVFVDDEKTRTNGFSATMYRDGLDEQELLDGVNKMKKSMVYTAEGNDWTCYTYHLQTQKNENALDLGLVNFEENIAQTMLFCKELKSVELDNNGALTKIERQPFVQLEDGLYSTTFIIRGENEYVRTFIHTSFKKYDEYLTARFKTERYARLTMAIEVDNEGNLVENSDSPSHFCVLPLVGSENHVMPFYLNSPDFEPDSERESLILIGDEIMADKGVISEGGINRLLLSQSVELFERMVRFFSSNNYKKLYLLAKGLKNTPKVERNFNKKWFEENMIAPYREVLKRYAIVETNNGLQKLFTNDKPYIMIPKDSSLDDQNAIYELAADLIPEILPQKEDADNWATFAWKECGLFKVDDLCEFVSNKENTNSLSLSCGKYEWLNKLLLFIKEKDESLLKEYELIPNRNGNFVSLNNEAFAEGVDLSDYSVEVLKELGEDIKPILLDTNINSISLPVKIDANRIAAIIDDQAKKIIGEKEVSIGEKIKRLKPLINTIPADTSLFSDEFIQKQKLIYKFTEDLFAEISFNETSNNEILEQAWRSAHKWLITQLMKAVSDLKNLDSLPASIENKVAWINNFIAFVIKEIKEGELDEYAIIPNQNGAFCKKSALKRDNNIPEAFKSEEAEGFNIQLKKNLLHKGIDAITLPSEINIDSLIEIINKRFDETLEFPNKCDRLSFAIFLLHFLPVDEASVLYKTQRSLLDIIRTYYYQRSADFSVKYVDCLNEGIWVKATNKVIFNVTSHIEGKENITGLTNFLCMSGKSFDKGDTIIFLNDVFEFLYNSKISTERRIVPNQNGTFANQKDLFFDERIPEELKDILTLVDPKNDYRNILAESSLCDAIKPVHQKTVADIADVIDKRIDELYKTPSNWENKGFIEAIEKLMIEWFPKNRFTAKECFKLIYKKKETIEMNVLWSLEERQRMQRARSIPAEVMDKFIEHQGNVESIVEENKKLEEKVRELESKITDNGTNEILSEFPDLNADRIRELLKLEERVKGWSGTSDYLPANEMEEKRNYENGYKGEAYIYGQLMKSGQYKNIVWPNKSEVPTHFEITDHEGNQYYINDERNGYDIVAETEDGRKVFIEVKSTRTLLADADKIALPISRREWQFVNKINGNDKYCLARVFDVENSPQGHYLSMMGIGVTKL